MRHVVSSVALFWVISIAGRPATLRAKDAPAELSTPKKAAKSFYTAMLNGDLAGVKADAIGTVEEFKPFEALSRFVDAARRLRTAIDRRFGKEEGSKLHFDPSPTAEEMARLIDTWEEHIDGDTARVCKKGASADGGVYLQKAQGVWRVKLRQFDAGFTEGAKSFPKLADVSNNLASEVEQGKYATAEDMASELQQRMNAVHQSDASGPNRPVTRPAEHVEH